MKRWFWRGVYGVILTIWLVGIPVAFSSRPLWGILWTVVGAFYLSVDVLIRRTERVAFLGIQRLGTGALLAAVGAWRFGWDDVLIFPLAAWQVAWGIAFLWISPRLPR
jgi:hypothetical protein